MSDNAKVDTTTVSDDILNVFENETSTSTANITDMNTETETCQGCLTNQPNQLAHMEEGGCLA